MARGLKQKTKHYLLARNIDVSKMRLLAIQRSNRKNPKPTTYVYHYAGTYDIYYNRNLNASYFIPMGYDDEEMKRFFDIFTDCNLTEAEEAWLKQNNYELT